MLTATALKERRLDPLTPLQRTERMSKVKSSGSGAELAVRRLLCSMGFRYRLHRCGIPGTPDIAFIGRRKLIFVHGCFRHRHPGCKNARMPKTRTDFWRKKLEGSRERDLSLQVRLFQESWVAHVVWECEVNRSEKLKRRLRRFMEEPA